MSVNNAYRRLREKADSHGYRLAKPYRRWEFNGFTPAYRLFDVGTNLPVADFDKLAEVEAWLNELATA
jgi:hypothetical protein